MHKSQLMPVETVTQIQAAIANLSWFIPQQLVVDSLVQGKQMSIHLQWVANALEIEVLVLKENGNMILACTCVHASQDQLHGKGMRVHNYALKGNGTNPGYRCTVCGKMKAIPAATTKVPDTVIGKAK